DFPPALSRAVVPPYEGGILGGFGGHLPVQASPSPCSPPSQGGQILQPRPGATKWALFARRQSLANTSFSTPHRAGSCTRKRGIGSHVSPASHCCPRSTAIKKSESVAIFVSRRDGLGGIILGG